MQETIKYPHLENSLPVPIVGDQVVSFAELIIFGQVVPAHGSTTKRQTLLHWQKHWKYLKCNDQLQYAFTPLCERLLRNSEYLQSCMSSPVGRQAEKKEWSENVELTPSLYPLTRGGVKGDRGRTSDVRVLEDLKYKALQFINQGNKSSTKTAHWYAQHLLYSVHLNYLKQQ